MAKLNIGQVNGNNNNFGDHNIINNHPPSQPPAKFLTRDDYLKMIDEIIELERLSVGDYLEDKMATFLPKNPDFLKLLYKDIDKVLEGYGEEGDFDLLIEDGDFVIEYGDIKLTGKPTNLHSAGLWLHEKLLESFMDKDINKWSARIQAFESDYLKIDYDVPNVKNKLAALRAKIGTGREKDKPAPKWRKLLVEALHLKPNFLGVGIDLNKVIARHYPKSSE